MLRYRHAYVAAAAAVAGLTGCASPQRGLEHDVRATLEQRSWPATSVLVVERGITRLNLGHRTPPARDPQDLVYPLGSISKMFTAAAMHRLAERGVIDLEAPASTYVSDWPEAWRAVRVRHLLGHTSGIPDFWFVPEAARLASDPRARAEDLARVMARHPLQFEPGSRFSYSNTAYQAAARIIELRTGGAYDAFLAREFFAPLGMSSMRHCRGDAAEMPGHVMRDRRVQAIANENYETARGDGGLCGSARDVARWFQAIADGSVTQGRAWDGYASPQRLSGGSEVLYGHGLSLRPLGAHRKVGHHGAMAGHSGMGAWYPARDLVIAVLASIGGVSADSIEQGIAATLLGVEAPRPVGGAPPAFHAGRFDVGPFAVELAPRDGALQIEAPPPGPRGRLVRIGAASYAMDGDPWGIVVHLECVGGQCSGIRLHMAGMEWPGRRIAR